MGYVMHCGISSNKSVFGLVYVMQLCLLQPPTAADDNDFLDFSHDDIFFINIFVL